MIGRSVHFLIAFSASGLVLQGDLAYGANVEIVARHGVGDGGPATEAPIGRPIDVAVAADGALVIADPVNLRIRRVADDGTISTIAGTGASGDFGDGGQAINAKFRNPSALAVGPDGTIYVADRGAHKVRAIDMTGRIVTVAGTGEQGFSGDGRQATEAMLSMPSGVATDGAGTLYIADTGNNRIRTVLPGGQIHTVAGNGEAGAEGDGGEAVDASLDRPTHIAVDSDGAVYFVDSNNRYVRRISVDGMIIGAGVSGEISGLDVASDGRLLASAGNRVWQREPGRDPAALAGDGAIGYRDSKDARVAHFRGPTAIAAADDGGVFVVDGGNYVVRYVGHGGEISTVAGNRSLGRFGDGGLASAASFSCADAVAGNAGEIYVSDPLNSRVAVIYPDGMIDTYAGNGATGYAGDGASAKSTSLYRPTGLAVDADGNLYIADTGNNRVRAVAPNGEIVTIAGTGEAEFSGDGGPAIDAGLDGPVDVAVTAAGAIIISDSGNLRVRQVEPSGQITTILGSSSEPDDPMLKNIASESWIGYPGSIDVHGDGAIVAAVLNSTEVLTLRPDDALEIKLRAEGERFNAILVNDDMGIVTGADVRAAVEDGVSSVDVGRLGSLSYGADGAIIACDIDNRQILRITY